MRTRTFLTRTVPLLLALLLPLAVGCRKTTQSPENAPPAAEASTDATEGTPDSADSGSYAVSETEATAFAQHLEASLAKHDAMPFVRAMDWNALTDAVLKDTPQNSSEGVYKREDLQQSLSLSGSIATGIGEKVRQGGAFHFLHVKHIGQRTAVMFRLVDPDGGLDYLDLYLKHGPGKLIQIDEIYLYHFGETLSNALRRTLMPELYVGGQSSYGVMMSDVVRLLFRENVQLIQKLFSSFAAGNFLQTLDLYRALPEELQHCKSILILRLQAAQHVPDPSVYAYALAETRELLKDDPCAEFLSLDYFFEHHQYEDALKCVDHINELIGGDVYLSLFRCLALAHLGRMDEAEREYAHALETDPRLKDDLSFQNLPKIFDLLKRQQKKNEQTP